MPSAQPNDPTVAEIEVCSADGQNATGGIALATSITNRSLLRILSAGFALVILLLLSAGVISLRRAEEMHESAARLVSEQHFASGMLQQLQLEQSTMPDVIYRLLRRPRLSNESAILARLDQLDATLKQLQEGSDTETTPEGWNEIVRATEDFSALARSLTRNPQRDTHSIEALFQHHRMVQEMFDKIMKANSQAAIEDVRSLEAQANRMVTVSLSLLGICLALAILCALLTLRFAASTLRQLERQANALNRVSWQMLQGQEEAARRFSHELHDELGQSLAAVKANLIALRPADFEARRADCIHLVDDSISNVRELSQLLRPVILDDFGLDAALRWLCERFQQRTGITTTYECVSSSRLPEHVETQLFRITQEALTNIARHAHANAVRVSLTAAGERVKLKIADNGEGLARANGDRGTGIVGMRARAVQAGGELSLRTPPGGGLEVIAALPLVQVAHDVRA